MKTLADLKRELKTGRRLTLRSRQGAPIGQPREVVEIQSNGVWLMTERQKKSWLDYPKASLLEFEGDTFRIYGKGRRPLTAEERAIKIVEPKDEGQTRIDLMTDRGQMYRRRVRHYKDNNALYLMGNKAERGMRYDYNTGDVWDDKVKGDILLEYVFIN